MVGIEAPILVCLRLQELQLVGAEALCLLVETQDRSADHIAESLIHATR